MKKILQRIFSVLGYTIVKKSNKKKSLSVQPTKRLFIEFVGPSGVGKTTVFRELQKHNLTNRWIGVSTFIRSLKDKSLALDPASEAVYSEVLNLKRESIHSQFSFPISVSLMQFFYGNLKEELLAREYNSEYTLIMEDGFFHNFGSAIMDFISKNEVAFQPFLVDRAVVYCTNSAQEIAKQIQKRNLTSPRAYQNKKSLEELEKMTQPVIDRNEKFVNYLKSKGVPVLYINTGDDLKDNGVKIKEFILGLQGEDETPVTFKKN